MTIRVTIDLEECTGSGTCVAWLPKVFAITDDGLSSATDATAADEVELARVSRACPSRAISVWRDGEQLA